MLRLNIKTSLLHKSLVPWVISACGMALDVAAPLPQAAAAAPAFDILLVARRKANGTSVLNVVGWCVVKIRTRS